MLAYVYDDPAYELERLLFGEARLPANGVPRLSPTTCTSKPL